MIVFTAVSLARSIRDGRARVLDVFDYFTENKKLSTLRS